MSDPSETRSSNDEKETPEEKNPRDQGFNEVPATQGLKTPPTIGVGEDSGEWTRGGGSDPNEAKP
jgi:hypothetical protein